VADKEELKKLQQDIKRALDPFGRICKISDKDSKHLLALEAALKRMPAQDTLNAALSDLRKRSEEYLSKQLSIVRGSFQQIEADYINSIKKESIPWKELDSGWRIDRLELETKRDFGQARTKYNRDIVVDWRSVRNVSELDGLITDSNKLLDKAKLNDTILIDLFWSTYDTLSSQRHAGKKSKPSWVPVKDFYIETQIELTRRAFKKQGKNLKTAPQPMPLWSFLYNVDIYRGLGTKIPEKKRLTFQTGSQAEQAKDMGLVTNGLNAKENYKVYCYITESKDGQRALDL
jgi:hypothetical protein